MSEGIFDQAQALSPAMTRREFLNYTWLASLGFVFVIGFGGATYFFSLPRFKPGEFGGVFVLGAAGDVLPRPEDAPIHNPEAKFWLANVDGSLVALYDVCVHLGCLYQWHSFYDRFECPCHFSRYQKDGTYISGPAPRSLDRMVVSFVDADSQVVAATNDKGDPVKIPDDPNLQIMIHTGKIILGGSHS